MSDCLHCDIHELFESQLQNQDANLSEIAAKVTEVLADLILTAPPDQQSNLMADILANLGSLRPKCPLMAKAKGTKIVSGVSGDLGRYPVRSLFPLRADTELCRQQRATGQIRALVAFRKRHPL